MTYKTNIAESVATICGNVLSIAGDKNQFGFQDKFYPRIPNRNKRSGSLPSRILSKSVNQNQGIDFRLFCRRWFGLTAIKENGKPYFTEEQILAMESEHGYREKCINLLAKLLKIKPNTIQRWGKGVAFDKIPAERRQRYETYLGYVDAIRVITTSLTKLDEVSILKVLQQLEERQAENIN